MVFFLNQNTSTNTRPGSDDPEFVPEQIVEMDADFPPTYEDLFDKSMNEDDKSLPCYEVACETQAGTVSVSNDGNGTSFMGETEDNASGEDKTKTKNEDETKTENENETKTENENETKTKN